MSECYRCGQEGHNRRDCPLEANVPASRPAADTRPDWCGACDPRTRLIDHGDYMQRCLICHPLGHQHLAQHQGCGGCGQVIYAWDQNPCGQHQPTRGPVASYI